MTSSNRCIAYGDHVIIYSSRDQMDSIIVTKDEQFQSKYGHYKHNSIVSTLYGSKFSSSNGRGFVYLLRPTPELWTLALPHRTQILYMPDIAFITSYLDIKPSSIVIEAGTGSGSFSHSLARTVGSTGKVHSFEYHEERYTKAREEFNLHGLDSVIELKHRNVCKDGFGLIDAADSVFLDVPAPWEAIDHARVALRKDRQSRISCFSPCIEQVLKTVQALTEAGFSDIATYETLIRTHDTSPYIAPPIRTAIERIGLVEAKKERRREGQIEEARRKREEKRAARKELEAAAAKLRGNKDAVGEEEEGEESERSAKRVKLSIAVEGDDAEEEDKDEGEEGAMVTTAAVNATTTTTKMEESIISTEALLSASSSSALLLEPKRYTFKAGTQSRGHTSYLTFATLLPLPLSSNGDVEELENEG